MSWQFCIFFRFRHFWSSQELIKEIKNFNLFILIQNLYHFIRCPLNRRKQVTPPEVEPSTSVYKPKTFHFLYFQCHESHFRIKFIKNMLQTPWISRSTLNIFFLVRYRNGKLRLLMVTFSKVETLKLCRNCCIAIIHSFSCVSMFFHYFRSIRK